LNIRRLGIIAVVLAVSIFGVELALSVLRERSISINVRAEGTPPSVASAAVEGDAPPAPGEAQSDVGSLLVSPQGAVVVDIVWRYRIGPRFPITTLRAEVADGEGQIVAAEQFTIDCAGSGSMQCDGEMPLILRFGVRDGEGEAGAWPVGAFTLRVMRTYAGIAPTTLVDRPVIVAE
jgi:hypothetical protein